MARATINITPAGGNLGLELLPLAGAKGIWVDGESPGLFPLPDLDESYAESPDSEGGLRTRSRPKNPTGSINVVVSGTTEAEFRGYYVLLQENVEQVRKLGGTIEYTAAEGVTVTYDVQSMRISDAPYDGTQMLGFVQKFTVEFTCLPYGRLAGVAASMRLHDSFYTATMVAGGVWQEAGISGHLSNMTFIEPGYHCNSVERNMFFRRYMRTEDGTHQLTFHSATGASYEVLKATSSEVYVKAELTPTALRIKKINAGEAVLATTAFAFANSTRYYLQLVMSGNVATANLYTSNPELEGSSPVATCTATLTGSDATNLGAGVFGYPAWAIHESVANSSTIEDWRVTTAKVKTYGLGADFEVVGVPGQVDALGDMTVTETKSITRRHVECGIVDGYYYDEEKTPQYVIPPKAMGGAESKLESGLTRDAPQEFGSWQLPHVGPRRVKIWAGCETAAASNIEKLWVRLAWREAGQAKYSRNDWVELPYFGADKYELDLGTINPRPPATGEGGWEGKFEFYTQGGGAGGFNVYTMLVIPASRWWKSRSELVTGASGPAFVARDVFGEAHEAGNLTADLIESGSTSSGWQVFALSDEAPDFQVAPTSGWVTRTATSDTGTIFKHGRAVGCTDSVREMACSILHKREGEANPYSGLLVRTASTTNYLQVTFREVAANGLEVIADLIEGGARQASGSDTATIYGAELAKGEWIELLVVAIDEWYGVFVNGTLVCQGEHASLAKGGALGEGGTYLFDGNTTATAGTRYYKAFQLWVPEVDAALFAGGKARYRWSDAIRESEDGSRWGHAPGFEGARCRLAPEGPNRLVSHVAVKPRRRDADRLPTQVNENIEIEEAIVSMELTPRVVLLG